MEAIFLILSAVTAGFALIFFLSLAGKKKTLPVFSKTLSQDHFEKCCFRILEGMKLEIDDIHRSRSQIDIVARNPAPVVGGLFLVQCLYLPENEVVEAGRILAFSSALVQDRFSKGIFITTGTFSPDLPTLGELAPIEFIDGSRLEELVIQYAPDYRVMRS